MIRPFSILGLPLTGLLCLGAACDEGDDAGDATAVPEVDVRTRAIPGYPAVVEACRTPVAEPTRLIVSATDDDTGAIGWVDIAHRTVHRDLALAQTDLGLAFDGRYVYGLNRFNFDYIDILDPEANLASVSQFSVATGEMSANPHAVHVDRQGEAYVTLFGSNVLRVFDVQNPALPVAVRDLDVSGFADADGTPEMSMIIACGDVAFISIERLDRNASFAPVDGTFLVPINLIDDRAYDFAPDPQLDAVPLLGLGAKQVRTDPRDPSGRTVLVLNSGLESVNLATGVSTWVIDAATFEAQGFGRFEVRTFDLGADGALYFVIAAPDWSEHGLYRASLEGAGTDLELLVGGLQTSTGDLEVVANEVWISDTTVGASGLRVFTLGAEGATEIEGSPFGTGLPPYGILPLP